MILVKSLLDRVHDENGFCLRVHSEEKLGSSVVYIFRNGRGTDVFSH